MYNTNKYFRSALIVKTVNGHTFELFKPLVYYREAKLSKEQMELLNTINPTISYVVPEGFQTNLASVPRIFYTLVPPFGRYTKAAVLHDYLCKQFHYGFVTRKLADEVFLEAMKVSNVQFITRYLLYGCVRLYAIVKRYK